MWPWTYLKKLLKASNGDYSDSAMIAWPALLPEAGVEDPHTTIFYFPVVSEASYTLDDLKAAVAKTNFNVFPVADVTGLEWFGPEANVPVLRLDSAYLENYYQQLKAVLDAEGIEYSQTYPDYKPHVTISPEAAKGVLPASVLLSPVEIWWQKERYKVDGVSS